MTAEQDLLAHSRILDEQIRATLQRGGLYSAIMGFSSGVILGSLGFLGIVHDMLVPILWTIFGGSYAFFVYILGRFDRLRGFMVPFTLIGFTTLPSSIYVFAHFFLPSGSSTYITGPPSYLYFFIISISGFSFDPRVALLSGSLSAVQYFLLFWIDRGYLGNIIIPDHLMAQDMTSPSIYFFKSLMMIFTGLVIATLSTTAKKLVSGLVSQEKEKFSIRRVLGEYVSEEVAEKVINDQTGRIAEMKTVAILFCDIRNFTQFSERHNPAQIVSRLNEYFEAMVEAIQMHGGTVDKFIGDAIMAVFGGVLDLPNPAESAVLAAISMRDRIVMLQNQWQASGEDVLDNGIGIHFGSVLQGTLGPKKRKDFTVIGDAVNTASRIEGLCKEFSSAALFSDSVFDQLPQDLRSKVRFMGKAKVKGKQDEIKIYGI